MPPRRGKRVTKKGGRPDPKSRICKNFPEKRGTDRKGRVAPWGVAGRFPMAVLAVGSQITPSGMECLVLNLTAYVHA